MSRFFCDSNCELDYKVFDEFKNIELIKMPYTIGSEQGAFDLGRSGTSKAFFDKMRAGAVGKTQALNESDYIEYFEPVIASGEDIFYVTFTHKMSATFESMDKAIAKLKDKYPDRKVTTVDSKGISMAAGIVVYLAAKKHAEGVADEELVKYVEQIRDRVSMYFTVADLIYLKRGGRLSGFATAMGTLLNLKPIIALTGGALVNTQKSKGRKKAILDMIEKLKTDNVDLDYPVTVLHADSKIDFNYMCDEIKLRYPDINIWEGFVGPVIGCHCGPDTLGLVFMKKAKD